MDLYILNRNRETIGIIDDAESVIWTRRYNAVGDFELYLRATDDTVSLLQTGHYVTRLDNEMAGVIQNVVLNEDVEDGNDLIVTGTDLNGLLQRRIVWNQTILSGNAEEAIRKLIRENIIQPTQTARAIPYFRLGEAKGLCAKIEKQVTGENLLECVGGLCDSLNYGFKVTFDSERNFVFDLYEGTDRSQNQQAVPRVIFSPAFDNLSASTYQWDESNFKNVALVAGEGEGSARKTTTVGGSEGLDRYELYVDARDLSTNEGEIASEDYTAQLRQRGNEQLAAYGINELFNGEVIQGQTYQYGVDYFLGDVVTVKNAYGMTANVRITEVIENEDATGHKIIPTFENWKIILDPDKVAVDAAYHILESAEYPDAQQKGHNTPDEMNAYIQEYVDFLLQDYEDYAVNTVVQTRNFVSAVAGDADLPGGLNGRYSFDVTAQKGLQSRTTSAKQVEIAATAYSGVTNAQAVAAAMDAVTDGAVQVPYQATQKQKTAAVQDYADAQMTGDASGVTALVTFLSRDLYRVDFSKGSANDSKTISMTFSESGDPHTLLLLHGEEVADNSGYARPISNTDVYASSAQSKFGGKSLYFNGTSAFLTILDLDIPNGSNDFTIDWWQYQSEAPVGAGGAVYHRPYDNNISRGLLFFITGTHIIAYAARSEDTWDISYPFGEIVLKEWRHYAMVRNGSHFYLFENGVQKQDIQSMLPFGAFHISPHIGLHNASTWTYFKGYIDELRVSDIARWTENFTPPTEPYVS